MKKPVKLLIMFIVIFLLCVLTYSGYMIFSTLYAYKSASNLYTDISSKYTVETPSATPALSDVAGDDEVEPAEYIDPEISPKSVDFVSLQNECSEGVVTGWLYSPGTVIDYPVVHTEDNQFYLKHLINGSYNPSGTLFIDCKCQRGLQGGNTIVYGHNMNDYSMFQSLTNYKNQSYMDEHPVMYLNTPEQNYRIEIFSAFITEADSLVYTIEFIDSAQKMEYSSEMVSKSFVSSAVELSENDKFITLSTCTYEFDNARFVVIGRLIKIH